jgi:hypothetical protein
MHCLKGAMENGLPPHLSDKFWGSEANSVNTPVIADFHPTENASFGVAASATSDLAFTRAQCRRRTKLDEIS